MRRKQFRKTPVRTRAVLACLTLAGVLQVTGLEHSQAAVSYTVTKLEDTDDGSCDADCSLREAVAAAEASPGANRVELLGFFDVYSLDADLTLTQDLVIVAPSGQPTVSSAAGAVLRTTAPLTLEAIKLEGVSVAVDGPGRGALTLSHANMYDANLTINAPSDLDLRDSLVAELAALPSPSSIVATGSAVTDLTVGAGTTLDWTGSVADLTVEGGEAELSGANVGAAVVEGGSVTLTDSVVGPVLVEGGDVEIVRSKVHTIASDWTPNPAGLSGLVASGGALRLGGSIVVADDNSFDAATCVGVSSLGFNVSLASSCGGTVTDVVGDVAFDWYGSPSALGPHVDLIPVASPLCAGRDYIGAGCDAGSVEASGDQGDSYSGSFGPGVSELTVQRDAFGVLSVSTPPIFLGPSFQLSRIGVWPIYFGSFTSTTIDWSGLTPRVFTTTSPFLALGAVHPSGHAYTFTGFTFAFFIPVPMNVTFVDMV